MVGLPSWNNVNLRVGRRQVAFEFARPAVADAGELTLAGFIRFADDHSQACEIARMHRRDWFGYVDSQEVIPVVSDDFPEVNGFYVLDDLDLPTDVSSPFHEVELELVRVGSYSDLRFESALIGTVKDNDFTLEQADAEPMHAPPPHSGYNPRHATSVARELAYEDDLTVYLDVPFAVDPKWSARPEDWYTGAATIRRRDPLWPQYGPIASDTLYGHEGFVEDIEIGNGMVRFYSTLEDPAVFEAWDGTAWRSQPIDFQVGGADIDPFDKVSILYNRPERCGLKFELGESGGGVTKLEVVVIRGERGIRIRMWRDVSSTLGVTTGVAMTNTVNRMIADSADANGHKIVTATMGSATFTEGSGTIAKSSTQTFDVYLSVELSGAGSGNQAADLASQYAAALNERIREVPA